MRYIFLRYVGSKFRLGKKLRELLEKTGKDTLVDLFGGSATVLMQSGFEKRIYNDINGDLINLFKVMACREQRQELLKRLRWTPLSRQIFDEDYAIFKKGEMSFANILDPVERARKTFLRQALVFGGKITTGGFCVSTTGRRRIKELGKYRDNLKKMNVIGEFFRQTIIENLDWELCIKRYGNLRNTVIFSDPPYGVVQKYYVRTMKEKEHRLLAEKLTAIEAPVICTMLDNDFTRTVYPEKTWKRIETKSIKNRGLTTFGHIKKHIEEIILVKKDR